MEFTIVENDQTELIPKGKIDLTEVFVKGDGLDDILKAIKEKAYGQGQDVSDKSGRENVKSTAFKIARSKTFLDGIGKDVVAAEKARVDAANGNRKKIRDYLDRLREEYRKPLTDIEEAEKIEEERKAKEHKLKIDSWMKMLADIRISRPYQEIATMEDDEFKILYDQEKAKWDEEEKAKADAMAKAKIEAEKHETEKAAMRADRKEIRAFKLKGIGFKIENDFCSLYLSNLSKTIILSLNEVADMGADEFESGLAEWNADIQANMIKTPKPKSKLEEINEKFAKAAEADREEVEASGFFVADDELNNAPPYIDEIEVKDNNKTLEQDIMKIMKWLDKIAEAVKFLCPVCDTEHAQVVVSEIQSSLSEFITKIHKLAVEELAYGRVPDKNS